MIILVSVVPDSKKFSISVKDNRLKIHLESPPENNKANVELITKLSKILGKKVQLISGHRSKHKKLAIDISEGEWNIFLKNI
ncbi:putative ACR, YggU family [Candidatus Bilamarchaeum dharawalense]|uniref:UPF0235 protein LFW2832_01006 n=1 Tax=Candidatus Bilamarchaeum dharawalense TaxID=2885759 RepID=A0A5E4LU54_9ARCH|nr:putative ACR, YggU family [Candidatus Bilamarchaeum dharawalense]